MIANVSNSSSAQPTGPSKPVSGKAGQKGLRQTPKDVVHISGAGQSALQEATETREQTEKEAMSGDIQAQRLLAREAAEKAAEQMK
ncbi:MAG: hypothetical protein M0022_09780 [Desulfobacteraceae bacterium]|nr:hypothetical protein [Desulfobacteraceae bacterium]